METVHQNGRFTLFSSKFLSIYSILYDSQVSVLQDTTQCIYLPGLDLLIDTTQSRLVIIG